MSDYIFNETNQKHKRYQNVHLLFTLLNNFANRIEELTGFYYNIYGLKLYFIEFIFTFMLHSHNWFYVWFGFCLILFRFDFWFHFDWFRFVPFRFALYRRPDKDFQEVPVLCFKYQLKQERNVQYIRVHTYAIHSNSNCHKLNIYRPT